MPVDEKTHAIFQCIPVFPWQIKIIITFCRLGLVHNTGFGSKLYCISKAKYLTLTLLIRDSVDIFATVVIKAIQISSLLDCSKIRKRNKFYNTITISRKDYWFKVYLKKSYICNVSSYTIFQVCWNIQWNIQWNKSTTVPTL